MTDNEAILRRMQAEIDQLKRVNLVQRLPLAETNLVRIDEPIDGLDPEGSDGELAGVGFAVPYYISNSGILHPFMEDESDERQIEVYNYSALPSPTGYHLVHRMPDGKRILAVAGSGITLYTFELTIGRLDKYTGDILEIDGEALVVADATIEDPLLIFSEAADADTFKGHCIYQGGKYWAIQGKCISAGTS